MRCIARGNRYGGVYPARNFLLQEERFEISFLQRNERGAFLIGGALFLRKGNKETKNVNFVQSLFVKMPKKKGGKYPK